MADWGLTRPLTVPEELNPEGGTVLVVDPLEKRVSGFVPSPRGEEIAQGVEHLSTYVCEVPGMFGLNIIT